MCWGQGEGRRYLRIFYCSAATPRRMRWQFQRVEKDDFITRDFQPESNFKYKTLDWFSLVTLQIHPPYSQFNPNCIKSIYLCSNFSSSSTKFIRHLRFTFLLNWLPLPPMVPNYRQGLGSPFHLVNHSQNATTSLNSSYTQVVQNGNYSEESLPDSGYQQLHLIPFLKLHIYRFSMYCKTTVEEFRTILSNRTFCNDRNVLYMC